MTYPRQLSEERYEAILPTLQELERLAPGGRLQLTDEPDNLIEIKTCLYVYWHLNGLKPQFKIRQLDPSTILICKTLKPSPILTTQVDPGQAFARECLLEADSSDECLEIIDAARQAGKLSADAAMSAYAEWERVTR